MWRAGVRWGRPPPPSPTTKYRYVFTAKEDEILERLVRQFGLNAWDHIALELPGRSSRQCRDRWITYLAPDVNRSPWSSEEDALLFDLLQIHGTRWGVVAPFFCSRTQNNVKNRWNTILRKAKNIGLDAADRNQFIDTGQKITSRSTRTVFEPAPEIPVSGPQTIYRLENLLN
jgi:hypothetical protein